LARLAVSAANGLLNALANGTAWNPFSSGDPYVSLHTGDPGTTGANEVSGGTYVRQQVPFNAASGGQVKNTSAINWTLMPTATVTHIGLWTAATAGTFVVGAVLTTGINVIAGATATLTAEHLTGSAS